MEVTIFLVMHSGSYESKEVILAKRQRHFSDDRETVLEGISQQKPI